MSLKTRYGGICWRRSRGKWHNYVVSPNPTDYAKELARAVHATLRRAGFEAYWAGGCVRDQLLGRPAKDYDVASSARPEQVEALFPRTVAVGRAFGVVQVIGDAATCEVATFRRERGYQDGRHPDAVEFCAAREDALRRDFTINGLFYDPETEQVIDYVNGRQDLRDRTIRAIGDPEERFREDHLRLLRAARFSATLEFNLEANTRAAVQRLAPLLASVSAERIQQETNRLLLEAPRPGGGLRLLLDLGLLAVICPEVAAMAEQPQSPDFHPEGDVFTHTCLMLDAAQERSLTLMYAALLHDVGKPPTAQTKAGADGAPRWRFERHAHVGEEMARSILERLRLPSREIARVSYCVGNHMRFMEVQRMRRSTLRELVGADTFPVELELHRLDCAASHGNLENHVFLQRFQEAMKNEPVLPQPWITGADLKTLGLEEGRDLGHWKKAAYESQLEGRFPDRASLMAWLQTELASRNIKRGRENP